MDAGEGGLPKAKAPRKRKAQPKGKTETGPKGEGSIAAHVKLENGHGYHDEDGYSHKNNDNYYDHDLKSPKLKRKRASPELNKSLKADPGGSDDDDGYNDTKIKGENDGEDSDAKLGASEML